MAEMLEYKCPCCGGAIEFNSKIQKMKCPYCDTEFEMDALRAYENEKQLDQPDEMNWESQAGTAWERGETDGIQVYRCQSCGGEIIGDETMAAASCPYCGNHVVLKGKFEGDLKPDYVIPFKLDKKAAKEGLKRHLHGKRLLPKVFKDENHLDEIKGVYVPFWLFDAEANARMRYHGTRVRSWSDRDFIYTETSHYSIIRNGGMGFLNVPVDGSTKMADELMESIEPFDFSEAVDFQTAYLAGYLANRYDVSARESVERANERIKRSTENAFRETVEGHYSTVVPEASNIRLRSGKAKYALYPVWILNTTWKGKQYTFAMNGQTGKFVGNLPIDWKAYFKWLSIWGVGFGVLIYACMWLSVLL